MYQLIKKEQRTSEYNQYFIITAELEAALLASGLRQGMLTVFSPHTTTGVFANEHLECLEQDIKEFLERLVPEDHPYHHARMLRDYGSTAGNPTGHLKALICGNHCHFPVVDGKLVKGGAQEVYFCEFDGPSLRHYYILLEGER